MKHHKQKSFYNKDNLTLKTFLNQRNYRPSHLKCYTVYERYLQLLYVLDNIYYFEDVKRFLKKSIPLTCFAMYSSKVWYQFRNHDFKKTLNLIIKNYSASLGNMKNKVGYSCIILIVSRKFGSAHTEQQRISGRQSAEDSRTMWQIEIPPF